MTRWIMKLGLFLLFLSTLAIACTNGDDNSPTNNTDDDLTNGSGWRITYFLDKDKEETSDFAGYTFVFEEGGVFKASKNGTTTTGTWQINSSSNKLIINTGVATKPLEELNDDWIITQKTSKVIKLKDDSGGGNDDGDELLTFEAI